jgi:hypothetical protein
MPTFKHCVDVHSALLEAELDAEWAPLGGKLNRNRWRVEFPGGSWIQFFGAREANSARGLRCDIVCADECDDIDPSVLDSVVKPWFSEPWSFKILMFGGTPRRGRHGILYKTHKLALDGTENHRTRHATWRDAPGQVDADYVRQVQQTTPPEVFAREWECDFDAAEGLVYNLFMERFHVRKPLADLDAFTSFIVGVDHGYEDPAVFLVVGLQGSGRDTSCHVVEEYYRSKMTITDLGDAAMKIKEKYRNPIFYADPSRPDMNVEYKKRGIRITNANNAIDDGVATVLDLLRIRDMGGQKESREEASLYVSPACPNTIREMGLYRRRRDPRDVERVMDDTLDRDNHAMDALRYAVFTHLGKPKPVRGMGQTPLF